MDASEPLRATVDKFVFLVPTDRLYSPDDCWVQQEGGLVKVGLTDFRQQTAGDVAFVECKPQGSVLRAGQELANLETIKVNLAVASPVSGTVAAVNEELGQRPELVNEDPYGRGWLVAILPSNPEELEHLLQPTAYFAGMVERAEAERAKR
jgi:glycine cleavage system H protein